MADHNRLIIFTRYPRPGTTKTRLIPTLGPRGAAVLQQQLTETTMARIEPLRQQGAMAVEVRYAGGTKAAMTDWLGEDYLYRAQGGGNLGNRLARATQTAFERGMSRVVMIGTDCPDLTAEIVARAFLRLTSTDLVVGPAADGGYYLIGSNRPVPRLFEEISWGSRQVLHTTLQRAEELGLSVALLPTLHDVDRPEDLDRLENMNTDHRTLNVQRRRKT